MNVCIGYIYIQSVIQSLYVYQQISVKKVNGFFFQWSANRTELILLIGSEYIGHVSDFNKSLQKIVNGEYSWQIIDLCRDAAPSYKQ